MNLAEKNRTQIEANNYVLKANVKTDYWFGLSRNKILRYSNLSGGEFDIIIYGDSNLESDYYKIPYKSIKDLLVAQNLYQFNERERWVGDIKNNILRIRKSNTERNISQYYTLPLPIASLNGLTDEDSNDYAIENAKREISVRIKQSKFRRDVLNNFDSKCCLTGISQKDLLVASHIIPWADKVEKRLDPKNGLCLFYLYDKLFDMGYFTIDPLNYSVMITSEVSKLHAKLRTYLEEIDGVVISDAKKFKISVESLQYHRNNIFKG